MTGARNTLRIEATPSGLPEWCETAPPTVTVIVPVVPAE
jgi:hypothetical protein